MVKILILTFLLDFGLATDTDVDVSFVSASEITKMVNDPYRGIRKADGWCNMFSGAITINLDHWNAINKWQKRELMYHELGHCLLNMYHNEEISIMNSLAPQMYHVKSDGSNWKKLVRNMKIRYRQSSSQ